MVDFYKLFKDELKYSLNKTQQLLKLQKYMKDGLWYEESHIICYIIYIMLSKDTCCPGYKKWFISNRGTEFRLTKINNRPNVCVA